ncbi:hypothetical protein SMU66_03372 [Streptococcus mutans N34]|nr:hypothetical protein [Streptococcus mutans]EMB54970.1 hypothetical protein SMU9_03144 [Streptococcus mutans 1ID3]EMC01321.1 hypothetical protein SMU66_03372 [Streptococcus mutans N34]MCB4932444.1 hypothetical protein [Streptococcus mutans]QFG43864.1 hypothetical protein FSA31_1903 [Streptococcus mutans]
MVLGSRENIINALFRIASKNPDKKISPYPKLLKKRVFQDKRFTKNIMLMLMIFLMTSM